MESIAKAPCRFYGEKLQVISALRQDVKVPPVSQK